MLYLTSTAAAIAGVASLTLVNLEWPRTHPGSTLLGASTGLYVLASTLLWRPRRAVTFHVFVRSTGDSSEQSTELSRTQSGRTPIRRWLGDVIAR